MNAEHTACRAGMPPFCSSAGVSGGVVWDCKLDLLFGAADGAEGSSTISGSSSHRKASREACCSGDIPSSGEPHSRGLSSAKLK
jgi:hypothetical protein